ERARSSGARMRSIRHGPLMDRPTECLPIISPAGLATRRIAPAHGSAAPAHSNACSTQSGTRKQKMRYGRKTALGAATLASASVMAFVTATGSWAWVNPLKDRYIDEVYSICDQGGFFVGSVPKVTNYANSDTAEGQPEQLIIGQAYVQFQIPRERLKWPL